jgi:hypothetical protein
MSLYSLSIRRPVLSTVFALLIMIFGAVGFYFLGVREYPAVDPPIISVSTQYRGANADVIDSSRWRSRSTASTASAPSNPSAARGSPPSPSSSTWGPTSNGPPTTSATA